MSDDVSNDLTNFSFFLCQNGLLVVKYRIGSRPRCHEPSAAGSILLQHLLHWPRYCGNLCHCDKEWKDQSGKVEKASFPNPASYDHACQQITAKFRPRFA
jgi:hypothetical protein